MKCENCKNFLVITVVEDTDEKVTPFREQSRWEIDVVSKSTSIYRECVESVVDMDERITKYMTHCTHFKEKECQK